VVCDNAERGMGASLACALRHSADAAGWVIALGDMPYVQPATVVALRDALMQGSDIAVPVRNGRRGNPVGFGSERLPQLLQVEGDQGARALLHANPWTAVEVDDHGIHHDIDSPADLE
jgi:molybdenum cofactor cytidylyltransferase